MMANRYQAWDYEADPLSGREQVFADGPLFDEVVDGAARQYAATLDRVWTQEQVNESSLTVEVVLNPSWRSATEREVEAAQASEGEPMLVGCDDRWHVTVVLNRDEGGRWTWSTGKRVSFGGVPMTVMTEMDRLKRVARAAHELEAARKQWRRSKSYEDLRVMQQRERVLADALKDVEGLLA